MKNFKGFMAEVRAQKMISTAVQRGNTVYVYGIDSTILATIPLGPNGQFVGFTQATVSIKRGHHVYIFGPTGQQVSIVVG